MSVKLSQVHCDLLPIEIRDKLFSIEIFSLRDLLMACSHFISSKLDIPERDVEKLKNHLCIDYCPTVTDCLSSSIRSDLYPNVLESAFTQLNAILKGGFYFGETSEIFGTLGSGKSTFCSLLSKKALDDDYAVYWIETDGTLHEEIVEKYTLNCRSFRDLSYDFRCKLGNFHVINCTDVFELIKILKFLCSELSALNCRPTLIVIDSLATIFTPLLAALPNCVGILAQIGLLLNQLSSEGTCCHTMVVNRMLTDGTPALGKAWRHIPHLRLKFSKMNDLSTAITVEKSHRTETDVTCEISMFENIFSNKQYPCGFSCM